MRRWLVLRRYGSIGERVVRRFVKKKNYPSGAVACCDQEEYVSGVYLLKRIKIFNEVFDFFKSIFGNFTLSL